jgi:hypothetical protein
MAYWFTGFFAAPVLPRPDPLPLGAVWREITSPFSGVGVSLPSLLGNTPARDEVEALARQLGVAAADRWLYLTYVCWAGRIDFVYGLGASGGLPFGPVKEDDQDTVKDTYIRLMAQFGVSAEDALRFAPFQRGFWGES